MGAGVNVERMREVEALTSKLEHTHLGQPPEGWREEGEEPALLWSQRRDELDRQEAELLRRVQGVREKVVGHMTRQHRSHDRETTATTN